LPQDLPPPNPADLRGGDAVLAEAQSLADRGNFQAAIKKAATVSPTSPMHANAQEKIRDFSNLAVQDLRRKAAQSFQSAMPITDVNIRAQYLEQAKQYLEQAIKEYPQATQLPTVRDNLRVISRDLDKLQAEKG
jgi:D-aminopeptidase